MSDENTTEKNNAYDAQIYLDTIRLRTNIDDPKCQVKKLATFAQIILQNTEQSQTRHAVILENLLSTSESIQRKSSNEKKMNFNDNSKCSTDNAMSNSVMHNNSNDTEEIQKEDWSISDDSSVTFQDIKGCEDAIEAIKETIIIPQKYPIIFEKLKSKRCSGILLYGPPGTGKSMIARATANEVKATFFNASCAQITSKWVGASEKNIKSLFQTATERSPSIIFFDEIDSIASARDGNTSIADQRLTNQLLIELDKINNCQTMVYIIAATNMPFDIDVAVMRRFAYKIYIKMPCEESRYNMFRSCFSESICTDSETRILAKKSLDFSGSDIFQLSNKILFSPMKTLLTCTKFYRISDLEDKTINIQTTNLFIPQTKNSCDLESFHISEVFMTFEEIVQKFGEDLISIPHPTYDNILHQLTISSPSVPQHYISKYTEYHKANSLHSVSQQ